MILNVLAVKDRAANAFMQPFFAPTEAMAVRSFREEVGKAESPFHKNPEDFDLYWLGTFDDGKGAIRSEDPRLVARAQDIRSAEVVELARRS